MMLTPLHHKATTPPSSTCATYRESEIDVPDVNTVNTHTRTHRHMINIFLGSRARRVCTSNTNKFDLMHTRCLCANERTITVED